MNCAGFGKLKIGKKRSFGNQLDKEKKDKVSRRGKPRVHPAKSVPGNSEGGGSALAFQAQRSNPQSNWEKRGMSTKKT